MAYSFIEDLATFIAVAQNFLRKRAGYILPLIRISLQKAVMLHLVCFLLYDFSYRFYINKIILLSCAVKSFLK